MSQMHQSSVSPSVVGCLHPPSLACLCVHCILHSFVCGYPVALVLPYVHDFDAHADENQQNRSAGPLQAAECHKLVEYHKPAVPLQAAERHKLAEPVEHHQSAGPLQAPKPAEPLERYNIFAPRERHKLAESVEYHKPAGPLQAAECRKLAECEHHRLGAAESSESDKSQIVQGGLSRPQRYKSHVDSCDRKQQSYQTLEQASKSLYTNSCGTSGGNLNTNSRHQYFIQKSKPK